MNVFISWSGDRSKAVAEALYRWLPKVIQAIKPWLSKNDIAKGSQWAEEMRKSLKTIRVGIICLTPENLTAPWILFESGALSNNPLEIKETGDGQKVFAGKTMVCTYLYDLTAAQVPQPLGQFQHTVANKAETKKLLQDLNQELGGLKDTDLAEIFEKWWPELETALASIPAPKHEPKKRPDSEILAEILGVVRRLESAKLSEEVSARLSRLFAGSKLSLGSLAGATHTPSSDVSEEAKSALNKLLNAVSRKPTD